jgi:Icc-related predicted phosphoesterase
MRALGLRLFLPGSAPWLVVSHVPPRDAGDSPDDPYHVGFAAYRTVLERLKPRLWLHGHTTRAKVPTPIVDRGPTTLINVTGSVLVELRPSSPS